MTNIPDDWAMVIHNQLQLFGLLQKENNIDSTYTENVRKIVKEFMEEAGIDVSDLP